MGMPVNWSLQDLLLVWLLTQAGLSQFPVRPDDLGFSWSQPSEPPVVLILLPPTQMLIPHGS